MSERKAIFLVALSSLVWSTSFPAVKIGLGDLPPFSFVFFRFVVGTFIYLLFFFLAGYRWNKAIFRERSIYLLGFFTFLSYLLQFYGQQFTLASRTALLINLFIIWVPVLAVVFLGEKFKKSYLVVIFLLIVGLLFLTMGGDFKENLRAGLAFGDLLIFLASFCWAFYVIISKDLLHRYSNHEINIFTFGLTALFSFPLALSEWNRVRFSWVGFGAVVYLALFCTVIAYFLYTKGLKYAGAVKSTFFVSLEVLFSFIISVIFLGEKWNSLELFGGFLMILSYLYAFKL